MSRMNSREIKSSHKQIIDKSKVFNGHDWIVKLRDDLFATLTQLRIDFNFTLIHMMMIQWERIVCQAYNTKPTPKQYKQFLFIQSNIRNIYLQYFTQLDLFPLPQIFIINLLPHIYFIKFTCSNRIPLVLLFICVLFHLLADWELRGWTYTSYSLFFKKENSWGSLMKYTFIIFLSNVPLFNATCFAN